MSLSDFGEIPFGLWGILFPISGIFTIRYRVGAVYQRDPAIFRHIDSPVGTSFVRVSPEAFEPDEEGKKIYMEQRKI